MPWKPPEGQADEGRLHEADATEAAQGVVTLQPGETYTYEVDTGGWKNDPIVLTVVDAAEYDSLASTSGPMPSLTSLHKKDVVEVNTATLHTDSDGVATVAFKVCAHGLPAADLRLGIAKDWGADESNDEQGRGGLLTRI